MLFLTGNEEVNGKVWEEKAGPERKSHITNGKTTEIEDLEEDSK